MSLKLNTTKEAYKAFPEKGTAQNIEQMPKLIAEGRIPLNVAGLMQRRLDVRNAEDEIKTSWIDNYFDTGDAVIYHPNGRIKVVLDSQHLREMTPQSERNSGALVLTEEVYNALKGEEFKKEKLGKIETRLSKEEAKAHPIWKVLAREQAILNDYVDYIFAEDEQRFNYDTVMGVYLGSCNGKTPEMRVWCVDRLGDRSLADGRSYLGSDFGRLVGLAPEALSAPGKGASNRIIYTMAEVLNAKTQIDAIEKVLKPESIKDIKSLVSKL